MATSHTTQRRLPLDLQAEIVRRYQDGESSYRLARFLQLPTATITRLLKRKGVPARDRKRHTVNEAFFDKPLSSEAAYVLGFIATDGCVQEKSHQKSARLCIGLSSRDHEHVVLLRDAMSSSVPIYHRPARKGLPQSHIHIHSQRLVNAIISWGITPNKTWSVRAIQAPAELLLHFWRGVLDGDGCWSLRKDCLGAVLTLAGNEMMTADFVAFIRSTLAISVHLYPQKGYSRPYYHAVVSKLPHVQAIARLLYQNATLCLARKRETVEQILSRKLTGRGPAKRSSM